MMQKANSCVEIMKLVRVMVVVSKPGFEIVDKLMHPQVLVNRLFMQGVKRIGLFLFILIMFRREDAADQRRVATWKNVL